MAALRVRAWLVDPSHEQLQVLWAYKPSPTLLSRPEATAPYVPHNCALTSIKDLGAFFDRDNHPCGKFRNKSAQRINKQTKVDACFSSMNEFIARPIGLVDYLC